MAEISYMDFDLLIERSDTLYRVRVLHSPCGQAIGEFGLQASDELNSCWGGIRKSRLRERHIHSQELDEIREFGTRLFGAVFARKIETCLFRSLDEAKRQDKRLRLQLRLSDVPELASLPWEYLYNSSLGFLVLSAEISLVRYLELPEPITPLAVKPPLKVLVMISTPSDYDQLDVEQEWTKLEEALRDLKERGLISLERLDTATLPALRQKLKQDDYHVFHFIGHGDFDEQTKVRLVAVRKRERKRTPGKRFVRGNSVA